MALLTRFRQLATRLSPRWCRSLSLNPAILKFSEEVQQALLEGAPVVALESTIITHGMPYPHNLETATEVEKIIRKQGATPATIAILKGQVTVGLSTQQLGALARTSNALKTSRRDMAYVISNELDGATTVAGTIVVAELAGIPIFATGGLGGVHRGGQHTLDVSADLTELGRSSTCVVCSGAKSILDIPRTLEYLETQGVFVAAYGISRDFPAFYTRRSGHEAPYNLEDAARVARALRSAHALRLGSGMVVAVPVPEHSAMNESEIEGAIEKALLAAEERGVHGKQITPFLLAAVAEATEGRSLDTNIALIKNNAKVGAEIAVEFSKLKNDNRSQPPTDKPRPVNRVISRSLHTSSVCWRHSEGEPVCRSIREGVLVIGGANLDRTYRLIDNDIKLDGSTHACRAATWCGGGVARNMADALSKLGAKPRLLAVLGDDAEGELLQQTVPDLLGQGCVVRGGRTAHYTAVLDSAGDCRLGLGDMSIHGELTPQIVDQNMRLVEAAPLLVLDGNLRQDTVDYILTLAHEMRKPVFFEPTDWRKAVTPFLKHHQINFASPNMNELRAMARALGHNDIKPEIPNNSYECVAEALALVPYVMKCVKYLIVTLGEAGVLIVKYKSNEKISDLFWDQETNKLTGSLYPVTPLKDIKNASGAGDCFASGFIFGMLCGFDEEQCINMSFRTAKVALYSESTVPDSFPRLEYCSSERESVLLF